MHKMGLMGTAMAAAALAVTPAPAKEVPNSAPQQDVRIGLLDVQGNNLTFSDRNTQIYYKEFTSPGKMAATWITESGVDHGQMMASAVVRQMRQTDQNARVLMFSANVFEENESTSGAMYNRNSSAGSRRSLSVNWSGARDALGWFKQNGVKVVLTAFNSSDNQALRLFMQTANEMGMVVFAGASNEVGRAAYPAQYPESISVAGDNKDLSFRKDPGIASWVNFAMDGAVSLERAGRPVDEGSSFAVAKVAAMGAYYVALNPGAGRNEVADAVKRVSSPQTYEVQGVSVTANHLEEKRSGQMMAEVARTGPASAIIASNEQGKPASSQAVRMGMAMAAAGMNR